MMEEDKFKPQDTPPPPDTSSNNSDDLRPVQVFDVSADLNISPIQTADPAPTETVPAEPAVRANVRAAVTPSIPPPGIRQADIPQSTAPKNNLEIEALRTYESDVAKVLSRTHASTASIVIAESKKDNGQSSIQTHEPSPATRNLILALISLVLIASGAFGAYYLYMQSPLAPYVPKTMTINQKNAPSLVPSDFETILPIDGLSSNAIISKIQEIMSKSQPANTIREIVPVTLQGGNETRVTASNMLYKMGIQAPDILIRSLNNSWMLGVYADSNGQKSVFVVATNNFFQNSFAGMLQWESLMPDDLKQYVYPLPVADIANAAPVTKNVQASNPTATTSVPVQTATSSETAFFTIRGQFTNKIVLNKDVREFITSDGRILFLYSFVDSGTLVLAGNEPALSEILNRLESQAYMR